MLSIAYLNGLGVRQRYGCRHTQQEDAQGGQWELDELLRLSDVQGRVRRPKNRCPCSGILINTRGNPAELADATTIGDNPEEFPTHRRQRKDRNRIAKTTIGTSNRRPQLGFRNRRPTEDHEGRTHAHSPEEGCAHQTVTHL